MTATEKIRAITQYVLHMSPVVRPAIAVTSDKMMYNRGWDDAMQAAQARLLAVLEANDADLA